MTLKLVNDTPNINGNNVTVNFTVSGPVAKVICTLDDKKIEEDCKILYVVYVHLSVEDTLGTIKFKIQLLSQCVLCI